MSLINLHKFKKTRSDYIFLPFCVPLKEFSLHMELYKFQPLLLNIVKYILRLSFVSYQIIRDKMCEKYIYLVKEIITNGIHKLPANEM